MFSSFLQSNIKCVLRTKVNNKGEAVVAIKASIVKEAGLGGLPKRLQDSGYACNSVAGVR